MIFRIIIGLDFTSNINSKAMSLEPLIRGGDVTS